MKEEYVVFFFLKPASPITVLELDARYNCRQLLHRESASSFWPI